jgi:hypothetical protein
MIVGCYHQGSRAARSFWPAGDALVRLSVGRSGLVWRLAGLCQAGRQPQTVGQVQVAQKSSACISAMVC